MKHTGLFRLVFSILLVFAGHARTEAQEKGYVSTKGKEVILPDGKPFIMRGTNLGNWPEEPKRDFADIRKSRPENIDHVRQALKEYLVNCRFENCISNKGYIHALGFK